MINTKLTKYLAVKQNPALALARFMADIEKQAEAALEKVVAKTAEETRKNLTKTLMADVDKQVEEVRKTLPDLAKAMARELRDEVYKNPDRFVGPAGRSIRGEKGPKGDRGDKGEAGLSIKGKDGYTPKAGVDYPNAKQIKQLMEAVALKPEDLSPMVAKLMEIAFKKLNIGEIARRLEKLPEKEKLDYFLGLKNQPNVSTQKSALVRGGSGGSTVKVYDLSSQLNGVLKTFTIPANQYVLAVHFSSTPFSSSRLGTDYTRGLTSITFTDEIVAAQTLAAGQSCLIEYVEA